MKKLLMGGAVVGAVGAAVFGYARRYFGKVRGPFDPTLFVWSRGLALLCDRNGGVDFVKRQRGGKKALRFDPAAYAGVRAGELVWVRLIALPQFVHEVLPHIREPFGLVTGDEDWAIPSGYDQAAQILANRNVVRWFTQNSDGSDKSGKVVPIPIGLDFHTISNMRKWGHWPATPREQEEELVALIARMPATRKRELKAHADFHFNRHKHQMHGDKRERVEALLRDNDNVVFQEHKLRRIDLWEHKTRYAFVVSPHGNGLDCHRTWESLVLGNIPIVRRSSLDALYDGLPVAIVDSWDEITHGNLAAWLVKYGGAFALPEVQERLTNRYWIGHMRRLLAASMAS